MAEGLVRLTTPGNAGRGKEPWFKTDAGSGKEPEIGKPDNSTKCSDTAERDESCLVAPPPILPEEIKRIREGAHVSQPVFARYLNTSESTVQKWEAGTERPSGMALKLLTIVEKHGLLVDLQAEPALRHCWMRME